MFAKVILAKEPTMSSTAAVEYQETARDQLKNQTEEEFLKDHTRDEMNELAIELGVEDPEEPKTKADLYEVMVKSANLPDPSLRGESTVDSPVALTWNIADRMWAEAREKGEDPPRRKDCVEAAKAAGVAHYTARTQYQAWFTHTMKGEKLVRDGNVDGIPEDLKKDLDQLESEEN